MKKRQKTTLLPPSSIRVKLLDFGLARPTADGARLTQQGAIIGTPAYMAPEQARGEPVDGRTDLFSLGCVLYRLCTGRPAFSGNDMVSTLMTVALESPPPPVSVNFDVPTELSDLVMRLLAKKAQDRPESAHAVAEALREIEGRSTVAPRPEHKAAAVGAARNHLRWPWLVALAGGVATAIVAGVILFRQTLPGTVRGKIQPTQDDRALAGHHSSPAGTKRPEASPPKIEPVRKDKLPVPGAAADLLVPGSVWKGKRTYRKGAYAPKSVSYELYIRQRDGDKFKGHVFDNGPGRNRAEVEGEIKGQAISWREHANHIPEAEMKITGALEGGVVRLTFKGFYGPGRATNEGDGELKLVGPGLK